VVDLVGHTALTASVGRGGARSTSAITGGSCSYSEPTTSRAPRPPVMQPRTVAPARARPAEGSKPAARRADDVVVAVGHLPRPDFAPLVLQRRWLIQRQPGHANLGTTSIYLQGIDTEEIIAAVHTRRAPMMSATAGLQL
jgi:hypothetical protein